MWRNIFDLGAVTLYWDDQNGNLRPLSELAEGSITVVDGVVIATDVRSQFSVGVDEVLAIVAVVDDSLRGRPVRMSVSSIDQPRPGGGSGPEIYGVPATVSVPSYTATGEPQFLDAILNAPLNTTIIGVNPNQNVEIGDLDTGGTVGMVFNSTETLS